MQQTHAHTRTRTHTRAHTYTQKDSPLSHDTVLQVVLLLDVGMVPTSSLAPLAVVAAKDGGQLLLGDAGWGEGDGALLCQTPTVLQSHREETRRV